MAVLRVLQCSGQQVNFALTFCIVRLLVKAVAGGASKGSGKNKQHLLRAFSPNK